MRAAQSGTVEQSFAYAPERDTFILVAGPNPPRGIEPVTAKLSRKFYETFGDEIANDLVDWFNAVDATYRADLRELNELNFARFDAKLEQRLAELDAKWGSRWSQLDTKLEQRLVELGSSLRVEIHTARADVVKWMFVFWAPTAIAVIDLLLRRH